MRNFFCICIGTIFTWSVGLSAQESSCISGLDPESSSVKQLLECLVDMQNEIQLLKETSSVSPSVDEVATFLITNHREELRGEKGEPGDSAGLPQSVVIASTVECSAIGNEWSLFAEGTGRFIIGAGNETHRAYATWNRERAGGGVDQVPITKYTVLAHGGEEAHVLRPSEMPPHSHNFDDTSVRIISGGRGLGGSGTRGDVGSSDNLDTTTTTGAGDAHNNIPPYVALYYCRKDPS